MRFRNPLAANEQFGRPGRLSHRALILGALLMFLAPVAPSNTTTVEAEVAHDSTIYLPLIMQPPPTGPLSVQVTLDPAHRVQQVVPPAGGTLSVTAADGTKFSLVISERSLPVTRTITMTVVSAVQGLPFSGGLAGAVHLEPQGLLFYEPAILTIEPATPVPPDRQTFFAYDGDGQEFRLHPPELDRENPQPIRLPVSHFSGVGMASGTQAERTATLQRVPSDVEDQMWQELAHLLILECCFPDPEFRSKYEALMRRLYTEVVQPTMQQASRTGCRGPAGQRAVDKALNKALYWLSRLLVKEFGQDLLAAERTSIKSWADSVVYVCWADATKPCMDWWNPSQVMRVLTLKRQAWLRGLPASQFDPDKLPHCEACDWVKAVSDWTGSVTFSYEKRGSRSVYGGSITTDVARQASMQFSLIDAADWGGFQRWDVSGASGTGNVNDQVVTSPGSTQTWIGSGGLKEGQGKLAIDPARCKYKVEFRPYLLVVYSNSGGGESRRTWVVGSAYLFELPVPDAAGRVLSGGPPLPVTGTGPAENTFTHFDLGDYGSAAELEFALGKGNLGTAQVEWSLSPAPYW